MLDEAFRALAEPRRRDILLLVQERELTAGEIASRFAVTRPAISQHLKVLTKAGLITLRRHGTRRLYRARPAGIQELSRYLEQFWDEKLFLLARAAEKEEQRKRE